jgi:Zn-dependent peptidase ImmA (M78 family)/DNA-binding XRE family transcriptional regulator
MTLDQLAALLRITKQAISKYEHGKSIPSSDILDKIVRTLNVPRSYLVKDDVPLNFRCSALFFRTMSSTTKGNAEYADIISRWCYEILCGMDIHKKNEFVFPYVDAKLTIQEKTIRLRHQWNRGTLPIKNMTALLENNGFYVFVIDSAELKTDAYSRIINGIPIIVLNKKKGTAVRQRFSLAHELGHLILHRELSGTDFTVRSDELEHEANLFAEYFLMPVDGFGNSVIVPKLERFVSLKKTWGVSVAAMIYHCGQIGLINSHRTKSLQIQMSKQGWNKNEPLDDEIDFEVPKKPLDFISQQITGINSFVTFYDSVRLPIDELECLCSLPEGYFSAYYNEIASERDFRYTRQVEQLPLFLEEDIPHA